MAVVKAFGYGSDAVEVALELEQLGVYYFAVAYTSEGVALRKAGIKSPILVLHPQPDNFELLLKNCLEPSLYSTRVFKAFQAFAKAHSQKQYPVSSLNNNDSIQVASLFSHLAASEDPKEIDFTQSQINTFKEITDVLCSQLDNTPFLHQTNTSAILNYPEAQLDVVRTGIGLYGYGNTAQEDTNLRPVARLKTVISQIHTITPGESVGYNRAHKAQSNERIATLPIGHADGISRAFGNGVGHVVINGQAAPIVGNVCMDMLMINITHINCEEGDDVTVFGEEISAATLAPNIN